MIQGSETRGIHLERGQVGIELKAGGLLGPRNAASDHELHISVNIFGLFAPFSRRTLLVKAQYISREVAQPTGQNQVSSQQHPGGTPVRGKQSQVNARLLSPPSIPNHGSQNNVNLKQYSKSQPPSHQTPHHHPLPVSPSAYPPLPFPPTSSGIMLNM